MSKITVLLADDHAVVREGLRALLSATPDIEVVGEADTGRLAVQLAQKLQPDVVVMDVVMPQLNGVEATRQIIRDAPDSKVLVLSSYSDDEKVAQLIEHGRQKESGSPHLPRGRGLAAYRRRLRQQTNRRCAGHQHQNS